MREMLPLFVSGFGAFVTLAGIVLFARSREAGQNRIKLLGVEAELSAPSLVVFVLGVFLTVFPWIDRSEEQLNQARAVEPIEAADRLESQKQPALALRLSELTCTNVTGIKSSGKDSPFIKVNGEIVWGPMYVKCPTPTPVSLEMARRAWLFGDNNRIELWESDSGQRKFYGEDDWLGESAIIPEAGKQHGVFTGDSSHYTLSWDVRAETR